MKKKDSIDHEIKRNIQHFLLLFCHFLIMNPLGTTTTLYISQLFSSTKVYLLFYSHKKLVNNMENKKKRPWTFRWTQQNFVYKEKKMSRNHEIMRPIFLQLFWQSISIYKRHVLHPSSWGHDIFCHTLFIRIRFLQHK